MLDVEAEIKIFQFKWWDKIKVSQSLDVATTRCAHAWVCKSKVLTLSDALTCCDLSVRLKGERMLLLCHSSQARGPMRNEDRRFDHPRIETWILFFFVSLRKRRGADVSGVWSDRWDLQVTLELVLKQWLASLEHDQINTSIQGTLQILNRSFGCNFGVTELFSPVSKQGPAVSMVTVWWSPSHEGIAAESFKMRDVLHNNICEN